MATLALSVAGQFVGGALGGPIGATIGRALGALAGSAIDQSLFSEPEAPRQLSDLRLQGSAEGGAMPRIYGWNRLSGNIIWATQLELSDEASSGGKGFGSDTSDSDNEPVYLANFAVGLCEGEVRHIGRVWADGRLLEPSRYTIRTYKGTETQSADTLIAAKQGAGKTPAYRGLCYLVFEALPIGEFGNRIPNISVEVCRAVGELENQVRAVTIIPGATEFGYDPEPRVRLVSPGVTALENSHVLARTSDWTYSLDELQALCPNLSHVALVVAWFGDDLRCGQCKVQPRVEGATRNIVDAQWHVSGQGRNDVPVMSTHDGGPAYGGTPSDAAVLAAIADLKSRGLQVTLYPIVLMDIPADNGLTDPYSGAGHHQAAYPWRGRITCDPAPGEVGSPDLSGAVTSRINSFLGSAGPGQFSTGSGTVNFSGGADWGHRRMILHYAHLCEMAGGVDAFLIGSELRGLSFLRSSASDFPFVDGLVDLAADVRSIVGAGTKITYAADWSEYAGLQPPDVPGDKLFHLDALWASDDIDAVGIDNYMPVADWRGPGLGPDAGTAKSPYQIDYLDANIAGGEGYDWYYASNADRVLGTRTPITDSTYDEPWVWRFKDLTNWWQNPHHNRIDGVRQSAATDWTPESKPIWFTELGCGAVDKGANQPNVFGDSKSSEDARPYFSDGTPDTLVQRQFLRAHHRHWQAGSEGFDAANNPISSVYAMRMVDPDRIYCWTWDARPFPAFPQQTDIWSDGPNYLIGHWLTGRLGQAASDELIAALASDYQVPLLEASAANALIAGIHVNHVTTMRAAASPLWSACGISIKDTPDGLVFMSDVDGGRLDLTTEHCAALDGAIIKRTRPNADEVPGQLSLAYFDRDHDYQSASVVAIADNNPHKVAEASNLVLTAETARAAAETQLRTRTSAEKITLALPPSRQAVEPGDRISLAEANDGPFAIDTVRSGAALDITGYVQREPLIASFNTEVRATPPQIPQSSAVPVVRVAHLPGIAGDVSPTKLVIGAYAQPWPGPIRFAHTATGIEAARVNTAAVLGELTSDLLSAPDFNWDNTNSVHIQLYSGHLSSVTDVETLAGLNRLSIQHDDGEWEALGFVNAELTGASTYSLTRLLRGQGGTDHALSMIASAGNPVMMLSAAAVQTPVPVGDLVGSTDLTYFSGPLDMLGHSVETNLSLAPALPLSPAALSAVRGSETDDIFINWIRRSRIGADSWALANPPLDYAPEAYVVRIYDTGVLVREVSQSSTEFTYTSAMQSADIGGLATEFTFTVQQVSAVLGSGHIATGAFHA